MAQGLATIVGQFNQASPDNLCLGAVVAAELRRMYPVGGVKQVAGDLACTLKAAENVLKGHLSSVMMGALISAYGPGWLAERVLETAGLNLEAYIEQQIADAESAAIRAREKAADARERLARLKAARSLGDGLHG